MSQYEFEQFYEEIVQQEREKNIIDEEDELDEEMNIFVFRIEKLSRDVA